jgi:hypothetical protein
MLRLCDKMSPEYKRSGDDQSDLQPVQHDQWFCGWSMITPFRFQ